MSDADTPVGVLGDVGLGVLMLAAGAGLLLYLRRRPIDRPTLLIFLMVWLAVVTADRIVGAPSWLSTGQLQPLLLAGWATALAGGIVLGWAAKQRDTGANGQSS